MSIRRRLEELRLAREQSQAAAELSTAAKDARRQQFFAPAIRMFEELRTYGTRFPAGGIPSSRALRDAGALYRIVVPISSRSIIEVTVVDVDSLSPADIANIAEDNNADEIREFVFVCRINEMQFGWQGTEQRISRLLRTTIVSRVEEWLAETVMQHALPAVTPPPRPTRRPLLTAELREAIAAPDDEEDPFALLQPDTLPVIDGSRKQRRIELD